MDKSLKSTVWYGLLGVFSILLSIVGYLYGHKLLTPGTAEGLLVALWQILVASALISVAGGVGERLLGDSMPQGLSRFALAAALGIVPISVVALTVGAVIGTSAAVNLAEIVIIGALAFRRIPAWWRNLAELTGTLGGRYNKFIAFGVLSIFAASLVFALAPPTEFDALVYHLSLPLAYLQQGRITYLPDTMFWGMPQLAEMLYVPLMRLGSAQAAPVFVLLVGAVALLGLLGYVRSILGDSAAWTAVVALVVGENLTRALSTAYVEWVGIMFGVCALISLHRWTEKADRKLLIITGICCGGALGTKYTAGVLLVGVLIALVITQIGKPFRSVLISILLVGLTAVAVTLPWWIKNAVGTGNPFYPFFFPSGAMDANRLDFYQKVPAWHDWRSVILLPWQATIWGIDGKEGFSASIGALLVGLSPLAWIRWHSLTDARRRAITVAASITVVGFFLWAVASRISGLLIQTRLYLAFFPAWAVLAGAGFAAIGDLRSTTVRFGRLVRVLIAAMLSMGLVSLAASFASRNPVPYLLRLEDEKSYISRSLGAYAAAMEALDKLPTSARVLMLWETRGYYCQPRCDSDEAIDRWFDDARLYGTSAAIIQAWHEQGYTDLLVFNLGRDFVRTYDYPQEAKMHWSVLDATLAALPIEQQIAGGAYTLYQIP